MINDSEDDED